MIWLIVSEAAVRGWLAPLLWVSGEAKNHGRRKWWRKAAQIMRTRKQKERDEGARDRISSTKALPQWLLPPARPHPPTVSR